MTQRWLARLSLISVGVVAMFFSGMVRSMEASLAAKTIGWFTPGNASATGSVVMFGVGRPRPLGLRVTSECTVAALWVPLVLAGMLALVGRRFGPQRVVVAFTVSAVLVTFANHLRLLLIAWAYRQFGISGYRWTHQMWGSLLTLGGIAFALYSFVRVLNAGRAAVEDAPWASRVSFADR